MAAWLDKKEAGVSEWIKMWKRGWEGGECIR